MCGIATISIGRSARGRIRYPLLRRLTRELLVELSPRGLDASGIAVVNEDECIVFKKPLRPDRLANRPKFEEALSKIGPQTNFIMLHSRASSVGNTTDNFNNHPIVTDPIIGIHNGTLYNDGSLFRAFKGHFAREGQVDSEIIFRLLSHYLDLGLSPQQAMQETGKQLFGAFTGAAVDMRHPHRMLMFKFQRPMSILRFSHTDTVVAVSEARFYDRSAHRLGIKAKDKCVYPYDGAGLVLDLNAGKITDKLVEFEIPVEENKKAMRRYGNQSWVSFLG